MDGCVDDLIRSFDVRWESARVLADLIDKGHNLGRHAGAVISILWLPHDERGKLARRIVHQAVGAGLAVDLATLSVRLASKARARRRRRGRGGGARRPPARR